MRAGLGDAFAGRAGGASTDSGASAAVVRLERCHFATPTAQAANPTIGRPIALTAIVECLREAAVDGKKLFDDAVPQQR